MGSIIVHILGVGVDDTQNEHAPPKRDTVRAWSERKWLTLGGVGRLQSYGYSRGRCEKVGIKFDIFLNLGITVARGLHGGAFVSRWFAGSPVPLVSPSYWRHRRPWLGIWSYGATN